MEHPIIVCYCGGTCGDLISALIDNSDVYLHNRTVKHASLRERLKKPHQFESTADKDHYMTEIFKQYKSIPSHDLDYHVQKNHVFIGITIKDKTIALRAANRFKNLHRPHVWEEMSKVTGAVTIEDYAQLLLDYSNLVETHTSNIVKLERILTGDAITDLAKIITTPLDNELYTNWLKHQQ
jgi:hypothetical protein